MKKKLFMVAGLFLALQLLILLAYVQWLGASKPKTAPLPESAHPAVTMTVQDLYFGYAVGRGLIQDPAIIAQVLDGIDQLAYLNDDSSSNIAGGAGLELVIYRNGGAETYMFTGSHLVKNHQDENKNNWYTHKATPNLYTLLDSCIQQRYPYPDF